MSSETVYKLGGVPLPYCSFEWPKYRGATPRVIKIDCPGDMFDQFAALAKSSPGGKTSLSIEAPAGPGTSPGVTSTTIEGVYLLRVVKLSEQIVRLILSDSRILISRRVSDVDFNIRFGDGYLSGTEAPKYKDAITELVASVDVLDQNKAANPFADFTDFDAKDRLFLSGQPLYHGIDKLLDEANADLSVSGTGKFFFGTRADATGAGKLPGLGDYSWHAEPPWDAQRTLISGIPRKIHAFYPRRHCLALNAYDPASLAAVRPELRVYLEQVYSSGGQYFTLEELLAHYNQPASLFSDSDIARVFYRDALRGINGSMDALIGSTEHEAITQAVQDGWRVLWRIKYTGPDGHLGGFTDWKFGKIKEDGSVDPAAVDTPWVEFCRGIRIRRGASAVGSPWTINQTTASHFIPSWDSDESNGVIRLRAAGLRPGHFAHPGTLVAPLTLQFKSGASVDDQEGGSYSLNGFNVIERQPLEQAVFVPRGINDFYLTVYVCATQRMPNNSTRWHNEEVDGAASGDIPYIELPPSDELHCIRDFVDQTQQGHAPEADGFGPILNQADITDNAKARGKSWMLQHAAELEGEGIAEGLQAFVDHECTGPIREVVLMVDGPVVRTRISAGNLMNAEARERTAMKRQAVRTWEDRGVPIV